MRKAKRGVLAHESHFPIVLMDRSHTQCGFSRFVFQSVRWWNKNPWIIPACQKDFECDVHLQSIAATHYAQSRQPIDPLESSVLRCRFALASATEHGLHLAPSSGFRKLPLVGHTFTHDFTDGGPIVGVIDVIEKIQELFAVRNSSPVRGLLKCLWSCTDLTFVVTVLRKLPGKRNHIIRGKHHAVSSD